MVLRWYMWESKEHRLDAEPLLLGLVEHRAAVHMPPIALAHVFRTRLGAEVAVVSKRPQDFLEEVVVLFRLHFLRTIWLARKIYFYDLLLKS